MKFGGMGPVTFPLDKLEESSVCEGPVVFQLPQTVSFDMENLKLEYLEHFEMQSMFFCCHET